MTSGVGSQANVTYYDHLWSDLGSGIVFKTYAGFTAWRDSLGVILLGQSGFFDNYDVAFLASARCSL